MSVKLSRLVSAYLTPLFLEKYFGCTFTDPGLVWTKGTFQFCLMGWPLGPRNENCNLSQVYILETHAHMYKEGGVGMVITALFIKAEMINIH